MKASSQIRSIFLSGCLIGVILGLSGSVLKAKPPQYSGDGQERHPSKIIRSCCVFGIDLRLGFIPFLRRTDITSIQDLGDHQYLGGPSEGNGIIYTTRGGFIDIAHLRDVADWTGYLFNLITSAESTQDGMAYDLGREAGEKTLSLHHPPGLDQYTTAELAGLIAYDISVWHEIASWFGASYIPLVPERYSSFSPEDLYSNLLGVKLGIKAIHSDLSYDEAMTSLISSILDSLGAVPTLDDTYLAMKKVEGLWWSNAKPLPSRKILLSRYLETNQILLPWQLDEDKALGQAYPLEKPVSQLNAYFDLNIHVRWPFNKLGEVCLKDRETISQRDFGHLITCIANQVDTMNPNTLQQKE